MKLVDRFQRWNKWRKHSMNNRLYKFLVLIGLQYSPTLVLYRTKKEEQSNKEKFDEIKRKYWYKKPIVKCYCIDCLDYDEEYKFCRNLGIHVTDDKFCFWGKPDMFKKPNVKEEN